MKFTNKSQAEIIGLVLIVFLLTLGMIFVIRFMANSTPSKRSEFSQTKIATGFLGSVLDTSSGCKQTQLKSLLQDCAFWQSSGGSIICENGMGSCEYVESAVYYMLNETLRKWHLRFDFRAYVGTNIGNPLFNVTNIGCPFEKKSERIPIPTDAGTLWIKLDTC